MNDTVFSSDVPGRLLLGAADDPAELAADRAADRLGSGDVPRVAPAGSRGSAGTIVDPAVQRRIERAYRSGGPVPELDREVLERAFDVGFGHVRLHTDAEADELCRVLGARAFTVDGHVFVDDEYRPGTDEGRCLLAHELAHVLQGETGVVRRFIPKGKNGAETVDGVLANLKNPATFQGDSFKTAASMANLTAEALADLQQHGNLYDAAVAAGMDTTTIEEAARSLVDSAEPHYYVELYGQILQHICFPDFTPDLEPFAGVKLKYVDVDVQVNQDYAPVDGGDVLDIHPPQPVRFRSRFAVHLPVDQVGQWYLGVVQNVVASNKVIWFRKPDGRVRVVTIWLDNPHYDGGGEHQPWYDNGTSRIYLGDARQEVEVTLTDRPGMAVDKDADETVHSVNGLDHFKTWLAVRHTSGTIAYLYYWEWQIVYDTDQCSVALVDENWISDGQGTAVLDGPRAAEGVQSTQEHYAGFGEDLPADEMLGRLNP